MLNQLALLLTLHVAVEVTLMVLLPPNGPGVHAPAGFNVSVFPA